MFLPTVALLSTATKEGEPPAAAAATTAGDAAFAGGFRPAAFGAFVAAFFERGAAAHSQVIAVEDGVTGARIASSASYGTSFAGTKPIDFTVSTKAQMNAANRK